MPTEDEMSKTHTFDDGTVVDLDDDVEVSDFLDAGDELDEDAYAALVKRAEAEAPDAEDMAVDDEPDGIKEGE